MTINPPDKNVPEPKEQNNTNTLEENTIQTHVHEFIASTKLAEEGDDRHNHRFAGVTSEVIPKGNSHVHAIFVNTDFFNHHHEVAITTGPAIFIGNGKHIHFIKGTTTLDDDHVHELEFTTLIDRPLL
ncbi:YmaF family protein [Bacillus sp. DX4.1]|uniref:YmaF family protein n=1 Tax=Bacillus sp. DX4.1 TaxID=3055867 RepID=UPI0025A077D7|nr:YmaF family protein [Bacillus sp. DX4.1]MDM5189427.1 YmaF family protein [Bacillus sp. DX4.1]